jgi:hypothetical protein
MGPRGAHECMDAGGGAHRADARAALGDLRFVRLMSSNQAEKRRGDLPNVGFEVELNVFRNVFEASSDVDVVARLAQ